MNGSPICRARHPDGYICTLQPGHFGNHVAYGPADVYARWPQHETVGVAMNLPDADTVNPLLVPIQPIQPRTPPANLGGAINAAPELLALARRVAKLNPRLGEMPEFTGSSLAAQLGELVAEAWAALRKAGEL